MWQTILGFTLSGNVLLRAIVRLRKSAEMFNAIVALKSKVDHLDDGKSVLRF
jgi:hypothetical protein